MKYERSKEQEKLKKARRNKIKKSIEITLAGVGFLSLLYFGFWKSEEKEDTRQAARVDALYIQPAYSELAEGDTLEAKNLLKAGENHIKRYIRSRGNDVFVYGKLYKNKKEIKEKLEELKPYSK